MRAPTRRVALSLGCLFFAAAPASAFADPGTQPTARSVNSLYLSNWADGSGAATPAMAIWMASQLSPLDGGTYGPRIGELRTALDWSTNQIVDWTSFFRDETHGVKYTNVHACSATAFFD